MRTALSLPLLTLAFSSVLLAQLNRGGLAGTIADPAGAGVPGAKVLALNVDTNAQVATLSGPTGEYAIPNLTPGTYNITAEAPGFKRAARSKLAISVAETVRADLTLEIGSLTETVDVTAEISKLQT